MILLHGDPNLKKAVLEYEDVCSPAFQADLQLLKEALKEYGGMGIAAPQLGISRRLLLIDSRPNKRYPHAPQIDLMVIANPRITEQSEALESGWEGCLSVPGKRVMVSRSTSVSFSYVDQDGIFQLKKLEGFGARVFLHEYDHLEGITIIDRVEAASLIVSEEEYFTQIVQTQK